jgi:uncharacterized protein YciI
MLFVLVCTDKPGSLDLRLATRPQHLAYLETYAARLIQAGALLDLDGRPCGSLLMIDVADRPEAEGFAEADPYNRAGLFESVTIRPYRQVFRDGERIA